MEGGDFDFRGGTEDPAPGQPPLLPTFEHRAPGREQRLQSDAYWRRIHHVRPVGDSRESRSGIDGADKRLARAWGVTPQTVRARWRQGRTPRVGGPSKKVLNSAAGRRWRYLGNRSLAGGRPVKRRRTAMSAVRFLKSTGLWESTEYWCIERVPPRRAGDPGLMSDTIWYRIYLERG